jgi:hypothetical protein
VMKQSLQNANGTMSAATKRLSFAFYTVIE